MIFRQLFDSVSSTYSYLLASRRGGEALIIDPVLEKVDRYLQLVKELDLKLVKAVDTHIHADHITGLGALRDRTHCITVMGEMAKVDVVSMRVTEGDKLTIEGLALDVLYTPGHTDDSYSFLMRDRVFTGDTLLIRGTGRTDFQNGSAQAQYESLFGKLLKLPDETLVYPAHDYKGDTVSSIGEEKRFNPRLQVKSVDEYVDLMGKLNLPNPKMMDVAVPANMRVGPGAGRDRAQGLGGDGGAGDGAGGPAERRAGRSAREGRAREARRHPGVAARALSRPAGEHPPRRHAARACLRHGQAHGVLLRLRRALGHGGAGGAGRRDRLGLPHPRRPRRLAQGQRAAGALSGRFPINRVRTYPRPFGMCYNACTPVRKEVDRGRRGRHKPGVVQGRAYGMKSVGPGTMVIGSVKPFPARQRGVRAAAAALGA